MRGPPRGYPLYNTIQLFGSNVGANHLPVGRVFLLVGSLDPRRKVQPKVSLYVTARYPLAHGIQDSQRPLRAYVPLLRRLAIPRGCLHHVTRKSLAPIPKKHCQVDLTAYVTLLGSLQIPRCSKLVILRYILARREILTYQHLGSCIPAAGSGHQCRIDTSLLCQSNPGRDNHQYRRKERHQNHLLP